jgi:transposase
MSNRKPPYPAEFRQQLIELVRAGKTPTQLSREFGCSSQSIANWVAQEGRDAGTPVPGKEGLSTAEREELVRLRRENRRLQRECERCAVFWASRAAGITTGAIARPVRVRWAMRC